MEEIQPNLFRLKIPLPDSPLKYLNSYVLKSGDLAHLRFLEDEETLTRHSDSGIVRFSRGNALGSHRCD